VDQHSSTLLTRRRFVEQLFRATEKSGAMPMHASPIPVASPTHPAARCSGGMRFDLDRWLAQFDVDPASAPNVSKALQLQRAVLPIAPVDPIAIGATGGEYLQALLMDPAYQLK
jgi:hypothetical protein